MRPVNLLRFATPVALAGSLFVQACTTATPSLTPSPVAATEASSWPSPSPTPIPTATTRPGPTPTPDAGRDPISVDSSLYRDMPVNLELKVMCGLCGPEGWLSELPRFRLYADGLAVFRGQADDPLTASYRVVHLDEQGHESLIRYALDEGGLRGAAAHYRGNADDAGTIRFALHAQFVDDGADVDVDLEPVIGNGTTDVFGDPIEDLDRRAQLASFAETLSKFDAWATSRGYESQPLASDVSAAALIDPTDGGTGAQWPWEDVAPADFGRAEFGTAIARVTSDQVAHAGLGPGGGSLGTRSIGNGRVASLLVRPVLPGDDRPGAFGLRRDVVATTVEPDLRVRSQPDVSDESMKYEPLLGRGDALYVLDGPVEGSGYSWYNIYAPRTGLTGWVAAAAKTGEDWIAPVLLPCTLGASPFEIVDRIGYDLMHLACYSGVKFHGTYRLARYPIPNEFELTCPDQEWIREPAWLNTPLFCFYDFGPDDPDTGGYDLPAGGVLHPSLADAPGELLDTHPDGLLVTVTGQLDHPDSRGCTPNGTDPILFSRVPLMCRATFVITELRPAG